MMIQTATILPYLVIIKDRPKKKKKKKQVMRINQLHNYAHDEDQHIGSPVFHVSP